MNFENQTYLDQLNTPQREAVTYCDGPQLVIAGAGSGKTRVLTYKIVHLLNLGYEPWRILALTFTNKAAREMRQRIEQLVGTATASKLWMGTFHSIFSRILRQNAKLIGYPSDYTIYDAADSKALVRSIIKDMDLDDKVYKTSTVLNSISMAKNAMISPMQYAMDRDITEADRRGKRPYMAKIYETYCTRCRTARAMDFDDLLYYTNVLLRDNPDVLRHYQEFFTYVLVDEYQDTNFAQHAIISQICQGSQHLCVVGDDAQSIYSFRGANIRNILNLQRAYPNLQTFKLEQNYRSTRNIIGAANSLIAKNTNQIRKNVFSERSVGDRIELVRCYSDFEEAAIVANRIARRRAETGDPYNEFAILYRTNAQSRALEESLRKRNIPYRIYGGLSFYQRKEVRDAIAYMRLTINPHDDESIRRIINTPTRGIGDTTLKKLSSAAIDAGVSIWTVLGDPEKYNAGLATAATKRVGEFKALIENLIAYNMRGNNAERTVAHIISETRLLSVLLSDNTPESISRRENLHELMNAAKEFVSTKEEEGFSDQVNLTDFLAEISLATDQDVDETNDGDEETERVTLMTIHAAKGLEFNNIMIVGVEEDLLPSAMSTSSFDEVEEERRLLYVAITRAKNFCMMSYASSRYLNGQTKTSSPSRFLRDIDPQFITSATQSKSDNGFNNFRNSFHSETKGNYARGPVTVRSSAFTPKPKQQTPPPRPISQPAASPIAGDYNQHFVGELAEGMTIEHPRFGKGTVTMIDTSQPDARITVDFDNVSIKTLLLKFAKFKIINQ